MMELTAKPGMAGLNTALWRDLERRLGVGDLMEWLETEAQRIAQLGRANRGAVAFSDRLLRDRQITSLRSKPYLPGLQTIAPAEGGYAINYNSFQRLEDQRFGIAHEIAHTLWFAPGASGLPLSPLQNAIGKDATIEWLCNRAAAAILLPRSEMIDVLKKEPFVLHEIPEIAKRYLVSERLVARRIFHDLAERDFSLLAVQTKAGSDGQGYVSWFAPSPHRCAAKKEVNRILPSELLPDVAVGTTEHRRLDARWWLLTESAYTRKRAKPLGKYPLPGLACAWVGRGQVRWYFAIPGEPV